MPLDLKTQISKIMNVLCSKNHVTFLPRKLLFKKIFLKMRYGKKCKSDPQFFRNRFLATFFLNGE